MSDEKEGAVHISSGGNSLDKMRKNPWIISTIVLGVVALVLVFMASSGGLGATVSGATAGENLVSFVNAQGDGSATVVSSEQEGALYKVTVDYKGQNIPVYVTLDGKYLISSPVPLDGTAADASAQQQQPAQDVPKSDKPVVQLYIMSLCPYGLQALKGILPTIKTLGDSVDFKLRFVSYIMHGKPEIDANNDMYCVQKEAPAKLLDYLSCFAKDGDSAGCLASNGIDKMKISSCVAKADTEFKITANYDDKDSWLSGRFPKYDVDAAGNTKYGVQGSPTLVINDQQVDSARDSASYLKTICAAFNNEPAACQTQLSAESPGPGLGYTTTGAAAASAAGCVI